MPRKVKIGHNRRADGTKGFLCQCGAETRVKDSRPVPGGILRRRRECPECGIRVSTYEVGASRYTSAAIDIGDLCRTFESLTEYMGSIATRLKALKEAHELVEEARPKRFNSAD